MSDDLTAIYLNLYIAAMNKIDDYFEYRCESKEDQEYVHEVLGELREELAKFKAG
jgi:hypothetical protein